jgi:threonine/homoserine/homoserine lactone efflux protein
MSPEVILAFCVFAFVASVTPGPNNLMLLASGMNYGFRASIPHILGVSGGFFVLVVSVGLGLGEVFTRYPQSYTVMKWAGAIYMLYLAWRIATSGTPSADAADKNTGKPLGFLGAAMFQWVNPKAWVMAAGAFSTYIPAAPSTSLVVAISALFATINIPCISGWTVFGARLSQWLREPRYARAFNVGMAVLLVVSLVPMLRAS